MGTSVAAAMVCFIQRISVTHLFDSNVLFIYSNLIFFFSAALKHTSLLSSLAYSQNMLILSGYKIFMQVI